MNKPEFLAALGAGLSGLPGEDIKRSLDYYSEMIDDRIEEGLSEEEAVAAVGTVGEIITQILTDIPLSRIVREKVKPKRSLRTWEIVLLILGSPVWLPLLLAAVIIVFAMFIVIWSLVLVMYACVISFAAAALAGVVTAIPQILSGNHAVGLFDLGAGLFFAGLTIISFIGSSHAAKWIYVLCKKMFIGIKAHAAGKGGSI